MMADHEANGGDRGQAATGTGRSSSSQNVPQEIMYRGVYNNGHKFTVHVIGTPMPSYLGNYATLEEAAKAHDEAALDRLGDQAILNFLPDGRLNPSRLVSPLSVGRKTSTFKGVSAAGKRWQAVCGGGKVRRRHLGYFASEEEAARAYDKCAKARDKDYAILNFLPDGSINPDRHHSRRRWRRAIAATRAGGVGNATVNTKAQEVEENEEEEGEEKEKEEEGGQGQGEAEGRPRKLRRLNEGHFIDLTQDEPMQAIAPSAPRASTQMATPIFVRAVVSGGGRRASAADEAAVLSGRRATAVTGGGLADRPVQPASTATRAAVTPASASRVKAEAVPAVPLPAPLPTASLKVEAPAAVPSSSNSTSALKMTLVQATALLSGEAFKRLATCEEGSEEMASLERLTNMLQQLRREARTVASSSSSASSGNNTVDLQTFLLTSVCPRYTAEELTGSHLDNVMQMGLCIVKL